MFALAATLFSAKPKRPSIETDIVHIVHFRNYMNGLSLSPMAKGGVTVAFTIDKNANVKAAVAVCSYKDNFQRKIGRELALERLSTKPTGLYYEFELPASDIFELSGPVAVEEVAYEVFKRCELASRAEFRIVSETITNSILSL